MWLHGHVQGTPPVITRWDSFMCCAFCTHFQSILASGPGRDLPAGLCLCRPACIESCNHLGWQRHFGSSSSTIYLKLQSPSHFISSHFSWELFYGLITIIWFKGQSRNLAFPIPIWWHQALPEHKLIANISTCSLHATFGEQFCLHLLDLCGLCSIRGGRVWRISVIHVLSFH